MLAIVACSIVACSAPGGDGGTGPVPEARPSGSDDAGGVVQHELDCEAAIDERPNLPPTYRSVLDSVALPTSGSDGDPLQLNHRPEYEGPNYFTKVGLLVSQEAEFSMRVLHEPDVASMNWTTLQGENYSVLHSEGCAGSGWIVFAGGLWVDEPMCVLLLVETATSSETVKIEVGEECA